MPPLRFIRRNITFLLFLGIISLVFYYTKVPHRRYTIHLSGDQVALIPDTNESAEPALHTLDRLLLSFHASDFERIPSPKDRPSSLFSGPKNISVDAQGRKVALVSLFKGSAGELQSFTAENLKQYSARHGYTFIDGSANAVIASYVNSDAGQKVLLTKFWIVRYLLDDYDWVWWHDADSFFLNHGKSLDELMDDEFDVVMPVGHSMDWHWGKIVNTGHFLVKSSPWSKRLFEEAWTYRGETDASTCPPVLFHPINHWLTPCGGSGKNVDYWLGDQGLFHALVRSSYYPTDYACHVKWVNMRDMNSELPWYNDGDLIVHMPGRSNEERLKIMHEFQSQTDFTTGKVSSKSGLLQNDIHDWRVQPGLYADYRGGGWNVGCRELLIRS